MALDRDARKKQRSSRKNTRAERRDFRRRNETGFGKTLKRKLGGETLADQHGMKGQAEFDRKEMRKLQKLADKGSGLGEKSQERLDYLQAVNKQKAQRFGKLIGASAVAGKIKNSKQGAGKAGLAGIDEVPEELIAKRGARLPYKIKKRKK